MKGSGRHQQFHGPVFFPSEDIYRKPNLCAKCLLNEVASAVRSQGCFAIYSGEDEKEMIAAQRVGLVPFWVGHTDKTSFYLRPEKINLYIQKIISNPNAWRGMN